MNEKHKIALGAWAWGNDGTFGDKYTASELKPVYDAAMEMGLNIWDTAYVYGMGTSERILGELMKNTPRENIIVSTKFTPQCEDGTAEAMQRMIDGSKRRLGVDVIDAYWIHNPMNVEKYTPMLIPLAQSGQIKTIGVSNHNLAEIKRANEILMKAGLKISAVQNHFSLLNRSSEKGGILDYCKANGIEFYAYMVLEQGALSGKYSSAHPFPEGSDRANSYNRNFGKIEPLIQALKIVADQYGISIAQAATAWAISKGTIPIVGVTKISQVEDAAKVRYINLADSEIAYLEEIADKEGILAIRGWEKKMD